jgi:hypothetical protein
VLKTTTMWGCGVRRRRRSRGVVSHLWITWCIIYGHQPFFFFYCCISLCRDMILSDNCCKSLPVASFRWCTYDVQETTSFDTW